MRLVTLRTLICSALLGAALSACGGPDPKVDKDNIRRNADDAAHELDRESARHQDER